MLSIIKIFLICFFAILFPVALIHISCNNDLDEQPPQIPSLDPCPLNTPVPTPVAELPQALPETYIIENEIGLIVNIPVIYSDGQIIKYLLLIFDRGLHMVPTPIFLIEGENKAVFEVLHNYKIAVSGEIHGYEIQYYHIPNTFNIYGIIQITDYEILSECHSGFFNKEESNYYFQSYNNMYSFKLENSQISQDSVEYFINSSEIVCVCGDYDMDTLVLNIKSTDTDECPDYYCE